MEMKLANQDKSKNYVNLSSVGKSNKKAIAEVIYKPYKIISESAGDGKSGKIYIAGEFGIVEEATENRRIYPKNLMLREINRLQDKIKSRALLGELDHPDDGKPRLSKVSHLITDLYIGDDNIIYGKAEVLDTDNGKNLRALAEAGVQIGVSLRGYGSTHIEGDKEIVEDDFELVTFDFVSEPAAHSYASLVESKGDKKMGENLEIIEEYNKKLEEAVTEIKKSYSERYVKDLEEAIAKLRNEVEKDVVEKVLKDPNLGLYKTIVEEIVSVISPVIPFNVMDEETRENVNNLVVKSEELANNLKRASLILRMENILENNPKKDVYYELIVPQLDNIQDEKDLEAKLNAIRESLKDDSLSYDIEKAKEDEIKKLKAEFEKEHELAVADIKEQYESKIKQYEDKINELESMYKDKIEEIEKELETEISGYEDEIKKVEDEKKELEFKVEEISKERDSYKEELKSIKERAGLLEAKLDGLRKIAFRPDYSQYEDKILECKDSESIKFIVEEISRGNKSDSFTSKRGKILEYLNKSDKSPKSVAEDKISHIDSNVDNMDRSIIEEFSSVGLTSDDIADIKIMMENTNRK